MSENLLLSTAANLLHSEKQKEVDLKSCNKEIYSRFSNEINNSADSKLLHEIRDFPLKVKIQPQFQSKIILHELLKKRIQYFHIFYCFVDIASIIIFYFDHLNYIENNFELTKSSYLIRSILLGVSGIICIIPLLS
jgi:hypothetical protein